MEMKVTPGDSSARKPDTKVQALPHKGYHTRLSISNCEILFNLLFALYFAIIYMLLAVNHCNMKLHRIMDLTDSRCWRDFSGMVRQPINTKKAHGQHNTVHRLSHKQIHHTQETINSVSPVN